MKLNYAAILILDQPHTLSMMTHAANSYSRAPPVLKPILSQQVAVAPGHPVSIIQTLAQPMPIVVKPDHPGPMPLHHQIIMKATPAPSSTAELMPPQLPSCGMAVKHESVSVAENASLQLQQFVKQELHQPPQLVCST